MVAVLERPDQTANKNLYIASVETSQNEILAALEEATGTKWSVRNTTTDKEVSESFKKLEKGDYSGLYTLGLATSFGKIPGLRANYVRDEDLANELLGLKMESVKETVARVVSKSSKSP